MQNKIDITSTAIEKGIDLAKNFLDKLIMPAVEETGLLIKDKVTMWKFNNEVKMLTRAKEICEKNGISPKQISLKLLCPLLENASLEEDPILQDKWAILLSNLVDSDQNIQNHVFPYILGQISTNEYLFLERVVVDKKESDLKRKVELDSLRKENFEKKKKLKDENQNLRERIAEIKGKKEQEYFVELMDLQKKKRQNESNHWGLEYMERKIENEISDQAVIPEDVLREFELSNLIRLGLVKLTQETFANSQTLEIPKENTIHNYVQVDLDIDIESKINHIVTELGQLFIEACTEKRKKTAPNKE